MKAAKRNVQQPPWASISTGLLGDLKRAITLVKIVKARDGDKTGALQSALGFLEKAARRNDEGQRRVRRCGHCGRNPAILRSKADGYYVTCQGADCKGPRTNFHATRQGAIDEWDAEPRAEKERHHAK